MKKHPFPNLHPKVIEDAKKKLDELDVLFEFSEEDLLTPVRGSRWEPLLQEDVEALQKNLLSNLSTNFPSVASRLKANERSSQGRAALNQNPFKK